MSVHLCWHSFFRIIMRNIFLVLILVFNITACDNNGYKFPQANIKYSTNHLNVHRYGKALFELDTGNFRNELTEIQDEYKLFLDADLNDSANIAQLLDYVSDSQLVHIYHKTDEIYPDAESVETALSDAFCRYHYFYPEKQLPEIYTYISDLYYEMPVWKNDSAMVIALDIYLGNDFPLYGKLGLPNYKIRCMTPTNLPVDVMKTIYINDVATTIKKRTLLDHMIETGKMLTFLDAVLPHVPDSVKICYTADKLAWAHNNERKIWGFLIENNMIYSTDYQVQTKFIQDGPFTNGFSNKSPSRLGIFMGWQIVNSYMNNNPGISLIEMLSLTDSQLILQKSGYKPN